MNGWPGTRTGRGRNVARNAGGFSLVEILIGIAITTIVAAITIPMIFNMSRNSRRDSCINNLRQLGVALGQYHQDYRKYPAAPRPDYLADTLAQSSEANKAMPFSDKLNPGFPPIFTPNTPLIPGVNDLTLDGIFVNPYAATGNIQLTYTIRIVGGDDSLPAANPNTFQWDDGVLPPSAAMTITPGVPQILNNGLTVTFASAIGHKQNDIWRFRTVEAPFDATGKCYWKDWRFNGSQYAYLDFSTLNEAQRRAAVNAMNKKFDEFGPSYGLARFYYFYLNDKGNYLRSWTGYHCSAVTATEKVKRTDYLDTLSVNSDLKNNRKFDPLWSGYNTYDITYNYDQFYNAILAYDTALGFGGLNLPRQLSSQRPPGDSVVCWCYGHQGANQTIVSLTPDGSSVGSVLAITTEEKEQLEHQYRGQLNLTLFLDGNVTALRPRLVQRKTGGYCWQPPFLTSSGDTP